MRALICFLSLSLFAVDSVEEKYYSIDELEALAVKKNYTELVLALPHVIPAEKGKHWEELVETATIGQLNELYQKKDQGAILRAKALEKQFSMLGRSDKYKKAKRIGIADLVRDCYVEGRGSYTGNRPSVKEQEDQGLRTSVCTETAGYVFRNESDDLVLYEYLAPIVEKGADVAAVFKIYGEAIHVGNRDVLCKSDYLKSALMRAMDSNKGKAATKAASEFIESSCWAVLESEIYARLERMPASDAKNNWCKIVKKKNARASACR